MGIGRIKGTSGTRGSKQDVETRRQLRSALPSGSLIEVVSGSAIRNLDVEAVGALHLRNTGI